MWHQKDMKTLSSLVQVTARRLQNELASSTPRECVYHAARLYGRGLVMTTSFGTQSAVLLHLANTVVPGIPVIWIDTGYLPAETYRHAERLTARLNLNLHVYQSSMSPARMEALYGRLYDRNDADALSFYNHLRKVEPLQRALREHSATAWLTGIRAEQTSRRASLGRVGRQWDVVKVHPLLHMTREDIDRYLRVYALPRHPLEERGYATVGDWHTSRPLVPGETDARATRFRGLTQECGIHLADETAQIPRITVRRI
ncbi:MAG: phosphoadenylyl-sulfate reductase [bacterium]